jgi:hypothetical protein
LLYFLLTFLCFLIPNEFFMAYGSYVAPVGAFLFILIGLVLLVDFAHTWSETCLDNWERSESNLWQFILVGSTFGMFAASIALTTVLYVFFAGSGCGTNTFFLSMNLALSLIVTVLAISKPVQEANPKSGLTQASMVAAYCTYLTASAVANHTDEGNCNPLHANGGTKTTTVVIGALFTFLAIAYSTSRAATQSKALVGKGHRAGAGAISLSNDNDEDGEVRLVTNQPKGRKDEMRYQAILAAVNAGSLPASVLDEPEDDDDEIEAITGEERDDERGGTKYNVGVSAAALGYQLTRVVLVVPHYIRHGIDVCRWLAHRLVCLCFVIEPADQSGRSFRRRQSRILPILCLSLQASLPSSATSKMCTLADRKRRCG